MSRFDFGSTDGVNNEAAQVAESVKAVEIKRLHLAIDQIELLATKLRQKKYESDPSDKDPETNVKIEVLEGENTRLRTTIESLEEKVSEVELNWRN